MAIHKIKHSCAFCDVTIKPKSVTFHSRKGDVTISEGDTIDGGNFSTNIKEYTDHAILKEIPFNLNFMNKPNFHNWNLTGNNTGKVANSKKDECYHNHIEEMGGEITNYKNLPVCPENCRHANPKTITIDGVKKTIYEGTYEDKQL